MASIEYNAYKKAKFNGTIIATTDTIVAMLVTSSYVPNPDHPFVNSGAGTANPATNEVADGSYARKTLASKTANQDDTGDLGFFDAADLTWATLTGVTAAAVIIFKDTGSDATSPLMYFIDDGGFPKTPGGADLVIQWAATGIGQIA